MSQNPFTPSFGVSPPVLSGRDEVLDLFTEALEEGPGSPYRAVVVTGQRGTGKTVMLNALEDAARAQKWVVISETARPGIAKEIAETSIPGLLRDNANPVDSVVTSANVSAAGFGGGLSRERVDRFPVEPSLRSALTELAQGMDQKGGGVLLTIDEVSSDAAADLQIITQVVQQTFREGRQVMFAAAGLPANMQELLNAPGATFLRRAERCHLGPMGIDEVSTAIEEPVHMAGKTITPQALQQASQSTQGYPFMVQLVGYQTWRAGRGSAELSTEHVTQGIDIAGRRVGQLVHEPALAPLSAVDRGFLAAMAIDDGPSKIGDIAKRMGVNHGYVSQYRARLIDAELIYSPARGSVDFATPYLREHIREQTTRATNRQYPAAPRATSATDPVTRRPEDKTPTPLPHQNNPASPDR